MSTLFAPHRVTVVVTATDGLSNDASRARVLTAAAGVVGVEPGSLRLGHEVNGRPHLFGLGGGAYVSLSHGRGVAALALTGLGPLGVDVEVERPVRAQRMADRWFTEVEAAWVRGRPERERVAAFFWLWTHKEAMGKAYGTGLGRGGLLRPGPVPAGRFLFLPRSSRLFPLPDLADLVVAAPFVDRHVMLAVAVLGRHARGAPVDVHLRPP
ncbi:4'-phosphopantetheinyl transferase superfamily protein [Streptomyces sp. C11-1]|uniref:4'-phosphopantetheinyl transferase superfamily protein n=1 Tax=Streptomyces durocortorensis TaxID=2811104 RepID=A0ABY9VWT1_9ACTN|nr:4'-phosphopantetheinyl transferase superfamily protein [Streptomyces durocortorensis]WNF28020.1 4'-phosphopantetheinyl transferase superfamily protein [Streptomyces durocortorensis]